MTWIVGIQCEQFADCGWRKGVGTPEHQTIEKVDLCVGHWGRDTEARSFVCVRPDQKGHGVELPISDKLAWISGQEIAIDDRIPDLAWSCCEKGRRVEIPETRELV